MTIDDSIYEGLTNTQTEALRLMIKGQSIALLGVGGTGKTYILNKYIDYCRENDKLVLVTAPTGIAATNCCGVTIHSQFSLGGVIKPAWNYYKYMIGLPEYKREAIRQADVLIIDEISMTRYDYFRRIMQIVEGVRLNEGHRIQVIVSGDFGQLPSILTSNNIPNKNDTTYASDYDLFKMYYPSVNTEGWAFLDREHWNSLEVIELTEVVRQSDARFIEALNKIRLGDPSGLDFINTHATKVPNDDSIVVCCTNKEVNTINNIILDNLPGKPAVFPLRYEGDTCGVRLPQDDILTLKDGCEVMSTVNAPVEYLINENGDIIGFDERAYINGSFGVVKKIHTVKDTNTIESVEVDFENGNTALIGPYTWEIKSYAYDNRENKFIERKVGAIIGIPLRMRSAITVHKSQGMTFDGVVINSPKFWDFGQLYTALSRVRSIEGLCLTQQLKPSHVKCSSIVRQFYQNLGSNPYAMPF